MATFTVTATQNIDELTSKTGGDIYNINGGTLTVDQHSRFGLNNASGTPITGTISGASIAFTYDYDANVQRGTGSNGDDAPITIIAGNPNYAKPVVATGTISRSKGISITLTAETDRAYIA